MMAWATIVERELRVIARAAGTYRSRTGVLLIAAMVAGVLLVGLAAGGGAGPQGGRILFGTLNALFLAFCILEGVRATSDTISREKREGTLGFVLLSGMTGTELAVGKWVAAGVRVFYGLLAGLPVLGLALVLGGVTMGEYARTVVGLMAMLSASLAAGVVASALGRDSGRCLLGALFGLAAWTLLPLLGAVLARLSPGLEILRLASPLTPWLTAGLNYGVRGTEFWLALVVSQVLGLTAVMVAGWRLCPEWMDRREGRAERESRAPVRGGADGRTAENKAKGADRPGRRRVRPPLLDADPCEWIASGPYGSRLVFGFACVLYLATIGLLTVAEELDNAGQALVLISYPLGWLLRVGVAVQATEWPAQGRREGAFELVLGTPVTVDQVVFGHQRAVIRTWRSTFALVFGMLLLGGVLNWLTQERGFWASGFVLSGIGAGGLFPFLSLLTLVMDLYAIFWMGTWMGLRSGRATHAAVRVLLLTQVLPGFLFCIPSVLLDVLFIAWAKQRVLRDFRLWAALPVGMEPERGEGWRGRWRRASGRTPPVIGAG